MPNLTPYFYTSTRNTKTNNYIETGTYLGEGVSSVLGNYDIIHSIELSEKWFKYNLEKFKNNNKYKIDKDWFNVIFFASK